MTENKRFTYRYNCDEEGSEFEIIDLDKDEYYPMLLTDEDVVKPLVDCLNALNDENKRLKSELSIYRSVASCDNCNHHYYDWDVDEGYGAEEVCCKGNDVSDGICRDWTWECARWSQGSKVIDGIFKGVGKNNRK